MLHYTRFGRKEKKGKEDWNGEDEGRCTRPVSTYESES